MFLDNPQTISGPKSITRPHSPAISCIAARKYCSQDSVCSQILDLFPRLCGLELGTVFCLKRHAKHMFWQVSFPVTCSTVTVTKCQAALKTLRGISYFYPTCLCKEPKYEPECNQFRDLIFDHPCALSMSKGKQNNPCKKLEQSFWNLSPGFHRGRTLSHGGTADLHACVQRLREESLLYETLQELCQQVQVEWKCMPYEREVGLKWKYSSS